MPAAEHTMPESSGLLQYLEAYSRLLANALASPVFLRHLKYAWRMNIYSVGLAPVIQAIGRGLLAQARPKQQPSGANPEGWIIGMKQRN
jgi:hypothetical protein